MVYVSFVVFAYLFANLIYSLIQGGDDGGILGVLFFLSYIGALIGMWIFGFLNRWLVGKRIKWLPNIISAIGLIGMLTVSLWPLYEYIRYKDVPGWYFGQISLGYIFAWQIPCWILVIYFIASLILVNKKARANVF